MNNEMSAEERDILDRFERGELRTAPDAEREVRNRPSGGAQYVQQNQASEFASNGARLQSRSLAGQGRRDSLSDTAVQCHPQVLVRQADREEVAGRSSRRSREPEALLGEIVGVSDDCEQG